MCQATCALHGSLASSRCCLSLTFWQLCTAMSASGGRCWAGKTYTGRRQGRQEAVRLQAEQFHPVIMCKAACSHAYWLHASARAMQPAWMADPSTRHAQAVYSGLLRAAVLVLGGCVTGCKLQLVGELCQPSIRCLEARTHAAAALATHGTWCQHSCLLPNRVAAT
jgi:hypothetical protein